MTMFSRDWTDHFYEMALLVSTRSKDPSTKVGALVVDSERRIVGSGYNGFPRGVIDDPARYAERSLKLAMVVHAEVNAILNATRLVRGCVLVSTRAPCSACSGVIIQSGIEYVICPDQAANSKWADDWMIAKQMLLEGGVQMEHAPMPTPVLDEQNVRKIVDDAVVDIALCGPAISATNLRMLSGAIAERVVSTLCKKGAR